MFIGYQGQAFAGNYGAVDFEFCGRQRIFEEKQLGFLKKKRQRPQKTKNPYKRVLALRLAHRMNALCRCSALTWAIHACVWRHFCFLESGEYGIFNGLSRRVTVGLDRSIVAWIDLVMYSSNDSAPVLFFELILWFVHVQNPSLKAVMQCKQGPRSTAGICQIAQTWGATCLFWQGKVAAPTLPNT